MTGRLAIKVACTLLAVGALAAGLGACGSSKTDTSASSRQHALARQRAQRAALAKRPPGTYLETDGDKDADEEHHSLRTSPRNDDRALLATYPQKPTAAERHAITAIVKRYYTAAAADNGAQACALLAAGLVANIEETQSEAGQAHGGDCATIVARLLARQHEQLGLDEVSTMLVPSVHVSGNEGLAVLGFRVEPESELILQREGGSWKVDALLASNMP